MQKMFDYGNWWGCEVKGIDGCWYAVHAPPFMDAQDAESWAERLGGKDLHQGGYMLAPAPGQTVAECIAEAEAICEALNEKDNVQ